MQNIFILNGTIIGRDTGIIVLSYPDSLAKWRRDTAVIEHGKFRFQGYLREASFAHLTGSKKEGNYNSFFLESGIQQIVFKENDFENFKMTGSFTQQQSDSLGYRYKVIKEIYKKWINEYDELRDQLKTARDSLTYFRNQKELSQVAKRNQVIDSQFLSEKLLFIGEHPDSYVSPVELYGILLNRQIKTDSAEQLYYGFTERIKYSITGKLVSDELYKRKTGIMAPDFSTKDINGKHLSISTFSNKYLLIDFWASWCVPCIKQFPELQKYYQNYNSKGFEILAISIDSDETKWREAIVQYAIQNFQHVLANKDIQSNYSNTTQPIPSQILINRNGIIIWNSMNQSTDLKTILDKEFTN